MPSPRDDKKFNAFFPRSICSESDPVSWEDHSQRNLRSSERERDQSARLRGQMSQLLSQCSQDMREQADRVEDAIARRVAETEEASRNLEIQLKEVPLSFIRKNQFVSSTFAVAFGFFFICELYHIDFSSMESTVLPVLWSRKPFL